MKKKFLTLFLLIFLCLVSLLTHAQPYLLKIVLDSLPSNHQQDDIFIAGNFNQWNPGNPSWKLNIEKAERIIIIPLQQQGQYEFKFTRGSWDKVMCNADGTDQENISIKLTKDTVLYCNVIAWKDDFSSGKKKHTLSKNVSILSQALIMPQLDRSRRIWLYLPGNYNTSIKRYPVLYMHDGQNLFDESTSGFGEWGIDEALDTLMRQTKNECIVVGIDNGTNRLTEYNPFDHERFGKGEGEKYISFIKETLKPYIDNNYRTLKDPSHTMIAGSSMGGLISYYAALYHPATFGKAGVFSPAFWTAPAIFHATDSLGKNVKGKLFFYMGGQEGDDYINDMYTVMQKLGTGSSALIYSVTDAEGKHNEASWRKWFPEFIRFMMADWTNYIIKD